MLWSSVRLSKPPTTFESYSTQTKESMQASQRLPLQLRSQGPQAECVPHVYLACPVMEMVQKRWWTTVYKDRAKPEETLMEAHSVVVLIVEWYLGVPHVPLDTTSSVTSGTHTTGWDKLVYIKHSWISMTKQFRQWWTETWSNTDKTDADYVPSVLCCRMTVHQFFPRYEIIYCSKSWFKRPFCWKQSLAGQELLP